MAKHIIYYAKGEEYNCLVEATRYSIWYLRGGNEMLQTRVQELEKSKQKFSDLIEHWIKKITQVEVAATEMMESFKRELQEKTNDIQGQELREDTLHKEITELLVSNTEVEKEKEFLRRDVQKLVTNTV